VIAHVPDSQKISADDISELVREFSRAAGGALIFALPVFMTMEMWELGVHLDRFRLVLLLLVNIPLLTFLSHYSGFEQTFEWRQDLRDVAIAYAIGILTSALILAVFGVISFHTPLAETLGKVAIQAVPASLGALLARSQFGGDKPRKQREERYPGELGLMAVGALFLGLNVAPTEEMILISYKMTPIHGLALVALSLLVMHAFVFASAFRGGSELSPETPWLSAFIRFTVVGYAIALAISAYVLWTFGSLYGHGLVQGLMAVVVLGFPCAIGAAAARLVL
jgi:putative integral membrane protein (TIGR02587 family)